MRSSKITIASILIITFMAIVVRWYNSWSAPTQQVVTTPTPIEIAVDEPTTNVTNVTFVASHSLQTGAASQVIDWTATHYLLGFRRGADYYVQVYDSQWQSVGDAKVLLEQVIENPRLVFAHNQLYVLTAAQLKIFTTDFVVVQELPVVVPDTSLAEVDFTVLADGTMYLALPGDTNALRLLRFDDNGVLQAEQSLVDIGQLITLTYSNNHLVLVSQLNQQLLITEINPGYQLAIDQQFVVDLALDTPLQLTEFTRSGDYFVLLGHTMTNLNDYQLVVANNNFQELYPPFKLNTPLDQPRVLTHDQRLFIIHAVETTTYADDGSTIITATPEVYEYSVK